jgi:toxin-antitoxin system PIN domain toxin
MAMLIPDVNVLVYASREESPNHQAYRDWLQSLALGDESFGLSELVCSAFLRLVTNPRIWNPPTPTALALEFLEALRGRPNCVIVSPGPRHWGIFAGLCRRLALQGNAVPDAYYAALAIESGNEWVTADRGFAQFPGLRWRDPLP